MDLTNVGNAGGFPWFNFSDGTGFAVVGAGKDEHSRSRTIQSADTLSWVRGRHSAKVGAEMRRVGWDGTLDSNAGDDFGAFTFAQGAFSGNAFVDFLLGLPSTSSYTVLGPPVSEFSTGYSFFAQDKWKISGNFTLDFGLRWELHPPMSEQSNNIANFDPATGGLIVPDHSYPLSPAFLAAINACSLPAVNGPCTNVLTASQVGLPRGLRRTYYGDWDPRLGFAWRPWPSEKTVFRGGVGIYTVALLGQVAAPLVGQATFYSRAFANYQGPGLPPLFSFPNVQPASAEYAPSRARTAVVHHAECQLHRDPIERSSGQR
jgi:outer membrane receptor protein involved in Fe transport